MFRDILNDKIGNLIAYMASEIPMLSLTKLLKLLYLIDTISVKKTGAPITWLEYKAWAEGPVAKEIYDEVKSDTKTIFGDKLLSLDQYISIEKKINKERNQEEVYIKSKDFSLSEFSRFEKNIINTVISEYGKLPAARLISLLHEKGELWDVTVTRNNLQSDFANFGKKSDVTIHLNELIQDDEILLLSSKSAYESLTFNRKFH